MTLERLKQYIEHAPRNWGEPEDPFSYLEPIVNEILRLREVVKRMEEGKVPAQEATACPQILAAENEGLPSPNTGRNP